MLFHSLDFLVLVAVVFGLYWLVLDGRRRAQNILILAASYVFYGWWDWRFLGLIILSSVVDYWVGGALGRSESRSTRKYLLWISLTTNLGLLGFFKYFNFFAESARELAASVGITLDSVTLDIVLPVGISFYTFQTLSYTIDVYRRKIAPTTDVLAFFSFVAFFPQLVAGPIERAARLLPQFESQRRFSYPLAVDGLRQSLWGLFKKVAIADPCGEVVDRIFADYGALSSGDLLLGVILFGFQIYADFSGYSDIAIGVARLFGFNLMTNFRYPYFAQDVGDFWRRWHISLSTWFRDYVYIPLGGSRVSRGRIAANVLIVFVVSGLWHGANWTFVIWGLIHALLFLPLILTGSHRRFKEIGTEWRPIAGPRELVRMLSTFFAVNLAWVFFRAPSLEDALAYLARMFSFAPSSQEVAISSLLIPTVMVFVVVEWLCRDREHALSRVDFPPLVRWSLYTILAMVTLSLATDTSSPFIYFQF